MSNHHRKKHRLDLEESASQVFSSLDSRGRRVARSTAYDALASDDDDDDQQHPLRRSTSEHKTKARASFVRMVQKAMAAKEAGTLLDVPVVESVPESRGHRRARTLLDAFQTTTEHSQKAEGGVVSDVFEELKEIQRKEESEESSDEQVDIAAAAQQAAALEIGSFDEERVPLAAAGEQPAYQTKEATALKRLKQKKNTGNVFQMDAIKMFFWQLFLHSYLLSVSLVLAAAAMVLFYVWRNPSLDALPGNATLSWWCNFFARQIVLFEGARILKYLFLDCLVLGSAGRASQFIGPFLTLLCLQAKDWPFIVATWGVLDICFVQGDNTFQNHWLHATGWRIYSVEANSGSHILKSGTYLRLLLCLVLTGVGTALKRTFLAVAFGRRQYSTFKPTLEKLLQDVVLLNEVANLSAQAEAVHKEVNHLNLDKAAPKKPTAPSKLKEVSWASARFHTNDKETSGEYDQLGEEEEATGMLRRTSSGGPFIKHLLDRWEEPKTESDKMDATIQDVLLFRRALAFMDENYPFGEDFGLATTRDDAIESAQAVFKKLCLIVAKEKLLSFEVLAIVAAEDDGDTVDAGKMNALRRLFRPDFDQTLTMLAFVQSCDAIYRRLRLFLASVNNAASLDQVLENVFNAFYYFVLVLLILSLLNFNAWSLLISMTSLLVSFSFAFGSTVSSYVQGILLIAVTRPFDLGDRIFLTPASDVHLGAENAGNSWFVEDITLSTTKLRFAKTGEIAYLGNHTLSDMRIYNCNRSKNAVVLLEYTVHINILDGTNKEKFRNALANFVKARPRMWVELIMCRIDKIDFDNEQVVLSLVFRHRNSWQDSPRIFLHREDLLRFIFETAQRLKIEFETPPPRRILFYGGELANGAVEGETHKKGLLRPSNIRTSTDSRISLVHRQRSLSDESGPLEKDLLS